VTLGLSIRSGFTTANLSLQYYLTRCQPCYKHNQTPSPNLRPSVSGNWPCTCVRIYCIEAAPQTSLQPFTSHRHQAIIPSHKPSPFLLATFLGCDMSGQSGLVHFQILFDSALQAYEKNTGVTLAEHPLAAQLQGCHSVESITMLLQHQAKHFSDFRGKMRIMKLIENTVSILSTLSANTALGNPIGLVRERTDRMFHVSDNFLQAFPPANAIQAGLAVLLAVCAFRCSYVYILVTAY